MADITTSKYNEYYYHSYTQSKPFVSWNNRKLSSGYSVNAIRRFCRASIRVCVFVEWAPIHLQHLDERATCAHSGVQRENAKITHARRVRRHALVRPDVMRTKFLHLTATTSVSVQHNGWLPFCHFRSTDANCRRRHIRCASARCTWLASQPSVRTGTHICDRRGRKQSLSRGNGEYATCHLVARLSAR